ncbi:MAG TPA: hypothetical protein GX709_04265 [Clostridiales bacterium]|nr:hypothetical protein [Clostridiales bacterium]
MKEIFYSIVYKLNKSILYIIDFFVEIFYKLSGFENIDGENGEILSHLVRQKSVTDTFFMVALIGIALLGVVTILAILKAQSRKDISNSMALERSLKAFIGIWLIPFFVIAVVLGLNVLFRAIHVAMSINGAGVQRAKIGAELFVIAASDAYIGEEIAREGIEAAIVNGTISYMDVSAISTYYNIEDINYLVSLLGGGVLLFLFSISSISLVQRIFEVVFLYLISPLAASTMPLDDGQRFASWRTLVIGKIVSSYSIVLSMNVYLMVLPYATSIRYLENNFQNALVHLLIVIAGAFSVVKTSSIVSSIIGMHGNSIAAFMSEIRVASSLARGTTNTILHTSHHIAETSRHFSGDKDDKNNIQEAALTNKESTLENLYK